MFQVVLVCVSPIGSGHGFFALRREAGGVYRFDLDDRQTDRHTMNLTARRPPAVERLMSAETIQPIPDPDGRFAGLVHGGVETITTAGGNVMLDAAVSYRLATGEISTVKDGFVFDWASIPLLFTWYIPPAGDGKNCYGIAALFHDWLYCHRRIGGRAVTRSECDGLFLEIMLYVGVTRWLAYTMWAAMRVGGWLPWWRRAGKDIIP